MALEEYARKRRFGATPEPPPAHKSSPAGPVFCVQRHDATRLHYDFRLEMDGVLKSWAIPKGPSLDPADKRMAVHVEDHPLDYGGFEGNIPAGNYGAGSVMLWDRGSYEVIGDPPGPAQLARGDLKIRLWGEKLKGSFALVLMKGRGKGNEWLLIKKKDEFVSPGYDIEAWARSVLTGRTQQEIAADLPPAAATSAARGRSAMPSLIDVMLATPAARPPSGPGWLYEIKWDGVRAVAFVRDGRLRLVSRNGNAMDRQYPELAVLPHHLRAREAILDGEIAALDAQGRPSFSLLQNRISASDANAVAHLARSRPVVLYLFDVLFLDGEDLRPRPLAERKQILASIVEPGAVVRLSAHFETGPEALLEAARANGLEGIVAKRAASAYQGRRSPDWLKIKIVSEQEFVIGGFTEGARDHFGALLLGYHEGDSLRFAGSVGTGFDRARMQELAGLLAPLTAVESPFAGPVDAAGAVTWVRPELVCEVRFAEWTKDGRLRAPVFLGLRTDVDPREVVRETEDQAVPPAPGPPLSNKSSAPLLPSGKLQAAIEVDGRTLKFTNLDKIWFPEDHITKRDVIEYYNAVADLIVPHLLDRPLSLKRYPDGIHGEFFFQKNTPSGYPSWLRLEPVPSEHNGRPIRFIVGRDRATLLYLANLGCIDQNPAMSRIGSLEHPDFLLIDLDPQSAEFRLVVEAAQLVRKKLDRIGLDGYPKTTGGEGMHVFVPLEPVYGFDQTRAFAEVLARLLAAEHPDLFTTPRAVARREKGKVYFDYLQNAESKTIAAVYVTRAYPGAPVATPLEWREVTSRLTPAAFTIRNAPDRFARTGDLFAGVLHRPQRLEAALERLEKLTRDSARALP